MAHREHKTSHFISETHGEVGGSEKNDLILSRLMRLMQMSCSGLVAAQVDTR